MAQEAKLTLDWNQFSELKLKCLDIVSLLKPYLLIERVPADAKLTEQEFHVKHPYSAALYEPDESGNSNTAILKLYDEDVAVLQKMKRMIDFFADWNKHPTLGPELHARVRNAKESFERLLPTIITPTPILNDPTAGLDDILRLIQKEGRTPS